jgi:regulator of nucleoside diphosphate kinase
MTVPVELHRLQPLNCEMAMFENAFDRLPPIYITTRDRSRLRTLLEQRGRSIPDVVRASLERELARAIICSEDSVPPDVVTMNSRALFSTDLGAEPQSRTLIYDDGYSLLGGTVSITTALGAALLGLRAGSRMPYVNIDGERRVLVLTSVPYQPEAQGRGGSNPLRRWPQAAVRENNVITLPLRRMPRKSADWNPDDPGPNAA